MNVRVSGAVPISHPEKVLFPDDGISKGEVCAYYEAVAPLMLPHVARRPVTMERFPAGIGKKGFIHKDVSKGFPSWLERVPIERRDEKDPGTVHYALANEARALVWMANQNSITPHVWCSRLPRLEQPDLCVFDLDPPGDDPEPLRAAALAVRALLDELGLPSFVKTSGSKGFHIVVPLDDEASYERSWRFAHGAGAVLVKRHPDLLTQEFIKVDRDGRIFVDTGRNGMGATFAAVYAVRPKPGAPVSAPCTWAEVESGAVGPRTFTLRTMAARIAGVGDLWADVERRRRSLTDPLAALERMLTEDDWKEAMAATTRRPTSRKSAKKR
jgi:bifunctional non-homologous end joining protein LigD